jgi:Domain of unknown function (DUF4116)
MTLGAIHLAAHSYFPHLDSSIERVAKNGLDLRLLTAHEQASPEIVVAACNQNGLALQFASYTMRADPDIVKAACLQNPEALRHAADCLRSSLEFITELLMVADIGVLGYANPRFLSEDALALEILKKRPEAFVFLVSDLKKNISFNIEAVQANSEVFDYLNEDIRTDLLFFNYLCFKNGSVYPEIFDFVLSKISQDLKSQLARTPLLLKDLSEDLKDNAALVNFVAEMDYESFQHASYDLKNNPSFIKYLIQNTDSWIFEFASEEIQNDDDIAYVAVSHHGLNFYHVSERLQDNRRMAHRAVSVEAFAYADCSDRLKLDPELAALAFLGDITIKDVILESVYNNTQFWAIVLHTSHNHKAFIPEELNVNQDFWEKLLAEDEELFILCPDELKQNRAFLAKIGRI